ncbi:MAG TPA: cation:proton antiporter [Sandaracinaceae bacterium LLY-WYZ-13_1]|nr:cation:proton antiporter [Sandaracinaceae bacterium LLY-WYZ-13_1]
MSGGGHGQARGGALRKMLIVLLLVGGVFLLHRFSVRTVGFDPSAMLALGFVILASYAFGSVVERIGLPHITGYLVAGLALGPSAAHLLPEAWQLAPFDEGVLSENVIDQLDPLNTLAVALIALTAGGELKIDSLRRGLGTILGVLSGQVVAILGLSIAFVIAMSGVVPNVTIPGLGQLELGGAVALGAVLGSISIATSPAATIAVINDVRARGPVTSAVLATVVLKDVVVVVLFAVMSTFAVQMLGEAEDGGGSIALYLLQHIGGALAIGAATGFAMALYLRYVKAEVLLFLVGIVYTAAFLASELDVEVVVLFITAGFVAANFSTEGDHLLETVETLSLPVYVVFFTLAGAKLHLDTLGTVAPFAVGLVLLRVAGIWVGTAAGGKLGGATADVRKHGWLGFVSQAGVAISLASIVGRKMGAPGQALSTLIIAGIALNELLGPVLLKVGLTAAGEANAADEDEGPDEDEPAPDRPAPEAATTHVEPWPAPDRAKDAWGEPVHTASPELNELGRELQLDLTHVARDVAEEPLARFREDALAYVRELRREFLRHHRRITVQALDEKTELNAAEALRLEQAELAEKWRAAVLGRAARVRQTPGWEPAPIIAAVDAITEGLPERVDAPYEKATFAPHPDDGPITAVARSWLRTRRGARRLFGEEMAPRRVELRALARYHLWGHLPERLEPVAALYVQAEGHLVARTRSIFDGLVIAYDELADEVEAARRAALEERARAKAEEAAAKEAKKAKKDEAARDDEAADAAPAEAQGDAARPETERAEDAGAPDPDDGPPADDTPAAPAKAGGGADEPGPEGDDDPLRPDALEAQLRAVRTQVDEELVLAVQEVDRIADDLAIRTSLALGACLRALKADLPHAATPDVPMRKRAASKLYRRRDEALGWLERGTRSARNTSAAVYNRMALEMELHALEGRVKDALEEHATALGRDVRGRAHRQVERVRDAIEESRRRLDEALSAPENAQRLVREIRAVCEPIVRVSAEAARVANQLRDQLADERSVSLVLDALTRSARGLTDRYTVPAGPIPRAEHKLPPPVGTVEVPFREWVLARIETSLAPRLLSSTRDVAQKVEPLAQALNELERRIAFNVELAVNELSVVEDEAPPTATVRLVREMIGGALERNRDLFAGYAEESERWGEEVRTAVRGAVLSSLDELRGGLVDGEAGRMRTQMVRDVRGRRLSRGIGELRTAVARAGLIARRAFREAVGEARLDRARARLGLPVRRAETEIGEHTFDPPAPQASIPMVYRRLFSAQALEAGDILTGRDEALERTMALLEGPNDAPLRTVAVVGPDGVGKSAFLNAVTRAKRWPKVRELSLEEPATVEQVEALFDPGAEGHLVVVSGVHWLASMRPGGFGPLRTFVRKVIEDDGRNAFLIRADTLVWAQCTAAAPLAEAFPEVIRLDPLDEEALAAAVLARHTVSGYGLVFSHGAHPQSRLEELVLQATTPLSRPQQSFFRALHAASGGLLRDALRLWLASVEEVDEAADFVHLGPVPSPGIYALRRLGDEEVLTLYQVARQGWMNAEVCASLFRIDETSAAARLGALAHVGILERRGAVYRLALHLRGSVSRLLEERGYVA